MSRRLNTKKLWLAQSTRLCSKKKRKKNAPKFKSLVGTKFKVAEVAVVISVDLTGWNTWTQSYLRQNSVQLSATLPAWLVTLNYTQQTQQQTAVTDVWLQHLKCVWRPRCSFHISIFSVLPLKSSSTLSSLKQCDLAFCLRPFTEKMIPVVLKLCSGF